MTKLDRKAEERLEKLAKEWDQEKENFSWLEKLTVVDLRLLLEHFEPLRKLIRQIAAKKTDPEEPLSSPEPRAEEESMPAASQEAQQEIDRLSTRCAELEQQLGKLRKQLEQRDQALRQALEREKALRASNGMEVPLRWIEHHPHAAQRLGLQGLGSDTQDLIRLVAILSQWDNILRLHGLLTEAGHAARQTDEEGITVLETALSWHNVNWRERPFRLERPTPGTPFDFNRQQRSSQTPTGETITQVLVPAIVDSNGKVICKAVVETR